MRSPNFATSSNVPLDAVLVQVEPLVAPQLQAKSLKYLFDRCEPGFVVRADREDSRLVVNPRYTVERTTPLEVEVVADPASGAYDLKLKAK